MRLKVLQLSLVVIASVFVGVNSTQAAITPMGQACLNGCMKSQGTCYKYTEDPERKNFVEVCDWAFEACHRYCNSEY